MTFRKRDYDEIFFKGLNTALKEGLISRQEDFEKYIKNKEDIENFYVMILSVHSEVIEWVYKHAQEIYDSNNIDKAEGVDLDEIGKKLGVPRSSGTRSFTEILFQLNYPAEETINIPEGTLLLTKDGTNFITSKQVQIPSGETTVIAPSYSTQLGANSNIKKDTIINMSHDSNLKNNSIQVRNEHASSGGLEPMSDDEYREYLKNSKKIHERGTEWAYREYFRNRDGINSYKLVPLWDGAGTLKVILDLNGNNGGDILYDIYTELIEHVAVFDDDIYICTAQTRLVDIVCSVNIDYDNLNPYSDTFKNELKTKIQKLIRVYIDGGNWNGKYYRGLGIGEDFIPYKLGVFLDSKVPELKNITFNNPITPIVLNDEEIATVGDIEISME